MGVVWLYPAYPAEKTPVNPISNLSTLKVIYPAIGSDNRANASSGICVYLMSETVTLEQESDPKGRQRPRGRAGNLTYGRVRNQVSR
jgi:hypothetical protein